MLLSQKVFISPSSLISNFTWYIALCWQYWSFRTWSTSFLAPGTLKHFCQIISRCSFLVPSINDMTFLLCSFWHLSFHFYIFKYFFYNMSWRISFLIFFIWSSVVLLCLDRVEKFSSSFFSEDIPCRFTMILSFNYTHNSKLGLLTVPQASPMFH